MRIRILFLCGIVLLVDAGPGFGQTTYTWNNTTANWSDGTRWDGTAPTGANDTDVLQFSSAGVLLAYTATNDVADPFILNRLNLGGTTLITGSYAGGGSGNVIAGSALRFAGSNPVIDFTSVGNYTITAPIELAADLTIRPNSSTGTTYFLYFAVPGISGSGALIVDGTGTTKSGIPLLGGTNMYSGGTQVLGGAVLAFASDNNLGTGGVTLNNGTLTAAGGPITSSRTFTLAGANTLASTGGAWRFNGVIEGAGGLTTSSVFASISEFAFAGNSNTYGGGTTVGPLTRLVTLNTSGSATGSGAVTVAGNGILAGKGIVGGAVTVNNTGQVSPGEAISNSSLAGNLRLDAGLDMSAGGVYVWNLAALSTANPGADSDIITLRGGDLALGGTSKLRLEFNVFGVSPNFPNSFWDQAREWTILDVTSPGTNSGNTTFAEIENPSWALGTFTLLDPSMHGGDVVLRFTPVPEPAHILLLAAGAGVVGRAVGRRRTGSR